MGHKSFATNDWPLDYLHRACPPGFGQRGSTLWLEYRTRKTPMQTLVGRECQVSVVCQRSQVKSGPTDRVILFHLNWCLVTRLLCLFLVVEENAGQRRHERRSDDQWYQKTEDRIHCVITFRERLSRNIIVLQTISCQTMSVQFRPIASRELGFCGLQLRIRSPIN